MSSFFRKVASAFVVIEEDPSKQAAEGVESAAGLDDITKETSSLLAQLEGRPTTPGDSAAQASGSADSHMELMAEDVFRQAGLGDDANSSLRLVKLVAGLSMFPREQQLAMVRAMDAADDTWAEADVLRDAQRRQQALREHLQRVAHERAQRMTALSQEIDQTKKSGEAVLVELDKRIAELYARREQEAAATATAVAKLEQQQKELEAREARARQGISQVIQALAGLLSFLGLSEGPKA